MGFEIADGKGSGRRAAVNLKNEINVRATQHTEEHEVSERDGQAYLISSSQVPALPTLTFLTTETGDVLYLENTGTSNLIVTSIIASASAVGGVFTVYRNRTRGSITQNTAVLSKNLNYGSSKLSTTLVDVWDETNGDGLQGFSNGDVMRAVTMPLGVVIDTGGAVIIPQGKSMTLAFNNITGGTIEFECGFRYYFDDEET